MKYLNFTKLVAITVLLGVLVSSFVSLTQSKVVPPIRPYILIILADDMGCSDVG